MTSDAMSGASTMMTARDAGTSVEDDLGRIIDMATDAMLGIDAAGLVTLWNARAEALLGWTAADVRGRPALTILSLMHDREASRQASAQQLWGPPKGAGQLDLIARRKDGVAVPVHATFTALRAAATTASCIVVRPAELSPDSLNARIRKMADNAMVSLWLSDTDKSWDWVNHCGLELLGRTTAPGHTWTEHVHSDDRQRCRLAYDEAVDARRAFSMEYRLRRHDGIWRTIVHDGAPLYTDDRRFLGYGGSWLDVTEWRQMSEVAAESQSQYRALAESLPHLVWTCLPDGWCDYLSRQWVEYTGVPEEKQRGYGWAEQLHPDDRERVRAAWAASTSRGDAYDVEFRIRRWDGAYRWFKTRALPLRDHHGNISRWFGSNTDFEEHKVSEQRLRVQLERLDLLDRITRSIGSRQDLNSMFEVVLTSLQDSLSVDLGCVCLGDHSAPRLSVAALRESPPGRVFQVEGHARVELRVDPNGLARCLRGQLVYEPHTGSIPFGFPQRLAAAGLQSLVLAPLMIESKVFGVLVAARSAADAFSSADCEFLRQLSEHVALATNQAELYQALQRAYDDLRHSRDMAVRHERLRALGEMAAGIAHNINNAISPVSVYTDALLESELAHSAEARGYLETIQRAIGDVTLTVAEMREFYRPRTPEVALARVSLNEVAQHAIDLTRARWADMAQRSGVTIRMVSDLDPTGPSLWGVASELREALTNLIFNAVDAMPDGGTIRIRTHHVGVARERGQRAFITVSDDGVGMDEELRSKCLEPFVTTKGERGTGLGLALVYGVVQRHEGSIDVESTPGGGTTIRIGFPLESREDTGQVTETRPRLLLRPLELLLIDDDALVLKVIRDTLARDGHRVTTAESGARGIETFRAALAGRAPFDAVITDLGMPDVDGRKVAAAVKLAAPTTPVMLLTGWGQRLSPDECAVPSVDEVLSKPPRLGDLREALARLCPGACQ
jgi:PAS domain S-box-containing protein